MRLLVNTDGIRFRVAGTVRPKRKSKDNPEQRLTPDGLPVWQFRLDAIDAGRETKETIWVEVAGDEPKLTFDEFATVSGLTFAPWVGQNGKIVRQFRADSVVPESGSKPVRPAA
jgi:hypothetical protein